MAYSASILGRSVRDFFPFFRPLIAPGMIEPHSPPQRIGRYEIKSLLGAGAMGSVYLAEDPRIKRKLAIKLVRMDALRSDQDRRELLLRFEREAEISGLLNDPGIVTIYDLGDSEFGPFLAMEYVQGVPLDAHIKLGDAIRLPIPARIRLLAGIAAALDHAHAHGIVHRDVKPANVMLTDAGRPKLMDFGIAKREDAGLTQTGTFLGTPSYASPEQIKDGHSTPKSDIFSLGVLAFELLSGVLPFQGNSINTILYRIVNEPPVEVHPPVLGVVPEAWRRVFFRVLAKEPAERYLTCAAFIKDLLDAAVDVTEAERSEILGLLPHPVQSQPLESLVIKAGEIPMDPHTTRVSRPKSRQTGLWVVFGLLILAGAGVALWKLPKGGSVLVKSQPRGAQILKDGRPLGETPLPLLLKAGDRITLEQPGYHPETRILAEGEKELDITMRGRSTEVRLESEPNGAAIMLDGRSVGTTPTTVTWSHWESHQLSLILKTEGGDLSHHRDFKPGEAPDGKPLRLASQAEHAPPNAAGTLRFGASYPVRVKVGSKDYGELRAGASLSVPPGDHRIDVSNAKYFLQKTFSVQLAPGAVKAIPLPELVELIVNTHPNSGMVLVDGQATGVESLGNTPIPMVKGLHVIAIQGAPSTQRKVDVDRSQTLTFKY